MAEARSEFENTSGGFIGVIAIEDGKRRGISVRPGDRVLLTEEEQIATANAPRSDSDNPFTNGHLTLRTPARDIANRRPIGDAGEQAQPEQSDASKAEAAQKAAEARERQEAAKQQEEARRLAAARAQAEHGVAPKEEVGASVSPSGNPSVGQRAPAEEVATPEAPAKAGAAKG